MIQSRKTYLALAALVLLALGLRVAAAVVVYDWAERRGERFLFPDSEGYWILGEKLAAGEPYAYGLGNARRVMRTPGYPLVLAAGIKLFGENLLAARLAGGVLGAVACLLVYLPAKKLVGQTAAVAAVGLAAVDPYFVLFSVLLLSETVFAAAVLVNLWALACMMEDGAPTGELGSQGREGAFLWPAVVGISAGAATLVRPSWLLFCPLVVVGWVIVTRERRVVIRALFAMVVLALSLTPWAWRNWHVTGHFVPLTLWVGASLYDGLHPGASGASDMRFLEQKPWKDMDELAQDRALRRKAWEFVRDNPGEALRLTGVKFVRFWSPWPNAPALDRAAIRAADLVWAVVVTAAVLVGAAACRRQPLAALALAGPVVYLCAVHLAFVGSIRYRIPGMYPLMSLAGLGLVTLWQRTRKSGPGAAGA